MMSLKSFFTSKFFNRSMLFNLLLIAAILVLFVTPLAHAILGSYTRYIADDWCTAASVFSQGLIKAQCDWYMNWSGRYSFTFAVSLAELIGIRLVPLLPTLALGIWIVVATWAVYQFRNWGIRSHSGLISLLIAELLVYAIVESIPNVHQSLYWQTGMLTYIAPLILLTIIIGFVIYNFRRDTDRCLPGSTLILGGLAFLAGGFSEMYVATQTAAFLIAIVIVLTIRRDDPRCNLTPMLTSGLVGSIASMAVIFFAPGNEIRQALTPQSPGIFTIIGSSMLFGLKFVGKSILLSPIPTSLTLFIPTLLTFTLPINKQQSGELSPLPNERGLYPLLLLSPFVGYLLIACSMAPSVYGVSAFPEDRTLTIPQFIFSTTTIFWGSLVGLKLKKSNIWNARHRRWIEVFGCFVVAVLLVLGPLASASDHLDRAPTLRAYAIRWDARDQDIWTAQNQGAKNLTVPALGFTGGLADIKDDPDYWVNRCFADYYGLDAIVAE
jgi:hypothetical protein